MRGCGKAKVEGSQHDIVCCLLSRIEHNWLSVVVSWWNVQAIFSLLGSPE